MKKHFNKESLPTPLQYLVMRGLLQCKPRGEWTAIKCPFHKNGTEENPSLRISLVDGHFKCHACGVKGGDILALHRLITGYDFVSTVRSLGGIFK